MWEEMPEKKWRKSGIRMGDCSGENSAEKAIKNGKKMLSCSFEYYIMKWMETIWNCLEMRKAGRCHDN